MEAEAERFAQELAQKDAELQEALIQACTLNLTKADRMDVKHFTQ